MAVTTTGNDIAVGAIAKSSKNRTNILASPAELIDIINRSMQAVYALAAEVNPTFFSKTVDVVYAAPGWPRPDDAENVYRIEKAGVEVAVVPYDDTAAETTKPAVYALGKVYRSAGNALDPIAADTLRMFYSRVPDKIAALADTLDPQWVEQHNELLILQLAVHLARKDGRLDELQDLRSERDNAALLFGKFLEHETSNLRRRFGQAKRFNTNMIRAFLSVGEAA